jgi:hypothetical protein
MGSGQTYELARAPIRLFACYPLLQGDGHHAGGGALGGDLRVSERLA